MTIEKCEAGQKSISFGSFPSDDLALEKLRSVDPNAPEGALCKSDGDAYRAVLKRIDVTKPAAVSGDSPTDARKDLIFQILDKQNVVVAAQIGLEKDRSELAAALKTRSGLNQPGAHQKTSTEKLLASIATAAFSFGVVTELFKDGATAAYLGYLAMRGPAATNLIYEFEKTAEMRRLALDGNLCGPLHAPDEPSEKADLWKGLAGPTLLGAAASVGAVALSRSLDGGSERTGANSRVADAPVAKGKFYTNNELVTMDLGRLREIDAELTVKLSAVSEQQQKILSEARGVYGDIYASYLGELKTRDLSAIQDEALRAQAQRIIARGESAPDASFLEKLGMTEFVGIGVGFGVGTGAMHRLYNGVAPWRDFIDRRMNAISKRARTDAGERIRNLQERKILAPCDELPAAAPETAPAKQPESLVQSMRRDGYEPLTLSMMNENPLWRLPAGVAIDEDNHLFKDDKRFFLKDGRVYEVDAQGEAVRNGAVTGVPAMGLPLALPVPVSMPGFSGGFAFRPSFAF